MDKRGSASFRLTFILQTLLTAVTVAGFVLASAVASHWWVWTLAIVIGIAVVVLHIWNYRLATRKTLIEFHSELDLNFVRFFSEWYEQPGEHLVFCKDLDWLDRAECARIVETLRRRGHKVTIIISEDRAAACARIREGGCAIIVVPRDIAEIRVKMSLYIDDADSKQLIIQRKREDTTAVRFARTDDTATVALAESLIQACKHIGVQIAEERRNTGPDQASAIALDNSAASLERFE